MACAGGTAPRRPGIYSIRIEPTNFVLAVGGFVQREIQIDVSAAKVLVCRGVERVDVRLQGSGIDSLIARFDFAPSASERSVAARLRRGEVAPHRNRLCYFTDQSVVRSADDAALLPAICPVALMDVAADDS